MAKVETKPFDAADYLKTPEEMAAFVDAAIVGAVEDSDPGLISAAVGVIARARGMSELARETGLSREQLYKSLSDAGNPTLSTLVQVLGSLGLRLSVVPAEEQAA